MKALSFSDFLFESINPYVGFWDAANGDTRSLVKGLIKHGVDHDWDQYCNFVRIRSTKWELVSQLLDETDIDRAEGTALADACQAVWDGESPSDTVQWIGGQERVPPGAYA